MLSPVDCVGDLYRAADLYLLVSRNEGFGYAACEALGSGIPVVFSDIPAVVWAQGVPAAVFFPSEDSAALANAIRTVLGWTPAERQDRTAASREWIRQRYDVRAWADRVFQIYRETLADR